MSSRLSPVWLFLVSYCYYCGALLNTAKPSSRFHSRSTQHKYYQPETIKELIEDKTSLDNDLWWDLFQPQQVGEKPAPKTTSHPSWIPDLGAWRAAVPEEPIKSSIINPAIRDSRSIDPPPSLKSYLGGSSVILEPHVSKLHESFEMIKRGSTRYVDKADSERLQEAMRIAYLQLWGKTTARSLEESVSRARGVAAILGELRADVEVVLAGVLQEPYDQIKDDENFQEIRVELIKRFGSQPIELCESYSKLPKFMARKADYTMEQSENHIQMVVAFLDDYRTLYIRLADRLHTLRLLNTLPLDPSDKKKIAQEALSVYAPLAHKMGVMKVKGELEDLAFRYLSPDTFRMSKYAQVAANKAYHQAAEQIQDLINNDPYLKEQKAQYRLTYRIKDKYQLNLKMQRKELKSVNEVRDALGLRIIVDAVARKQESADAHTRRSEEICYYFVSKLQSLAGWEPTENGFKDYIKGKKENGYQSLHQYIRNKALGTHVEVQVRSKSMHVQAELGEAAHWYYKDNIYREEIANSKLYKNAWRSKEQMTATSPAQLIGMARKQLLSSRVFVFLNDKATVLNLKKGATALDAAFAIHSEVGLATAGVTVNGKSVYLDRPLQNGETISVRTEVAQSPLQTNPQLQWLDYVRTSYARHALRQHFRDRERCYLCVLGAVQLMMALTLSAENILSRLGDMPDAYTLNRHAIERLKLKDLSELLLQLGDVDMWEAQSKLAMLLDMPIEEITTASTRWSLIWGRMQGRNGWEDKSMRTAILLPILRDILPSKGVEHAEIQWSNVIGPHSLTDEMSTYHVTLSRHLKSSSMIKRAQQKRYAGLTTSLTTNEEEEEMSRGTGPRGAIPVVPPTSRSLYPKVYPSQYKRVSEKPFSLEAASLPPMMLRIAKKSYANSIMKRGLAVETGVDRRDAAIK